MSRLREGLGVLGFAASRGIPGVITFVATPLTVAVFGAPIYGEYARIWAVSQTTTAIAVGWITQGILRNAGVRGAPAPRLPRWLLLAQTLVIAVPAFILVSQVSGGMDVVSAMVCIGFGVASLAYSVGAALMQRDQKVGIVMAGEAVRAIASSLVPLVMPTAWRSALVLVAWATAGTLAAAAIYMIAGRRARAESGVPTSPRALWSYGWPMSLWLGVSYVVLYADRFVVSALFSPSLAGTYAAVSDLVVRGFGMVALPVTLMAHPEIMRSANLHGDAEAGKLIRLWTRRLFAWLALATAVFGLVLFFVSSNALKIQPEFKGVAVVLGLMAALWQGALMTHKWHEVANRTRLMLVGVCAAALLSVALVAVLALRLGLIGASLGALAGPVTYIAFVTLTRRRLGPVAIKE